MSLINNKKNTINKIKSLYIILLAISFIVSLFIFLFSDIIIRLIFGNEFIDAVILLKIMSPLPIFFTTNLVFGVLWAVPNKFDIKILNILIIVNIVNILFVILLFNFFELKAPSFSIILGEFLLGLYFFYLFYKTKDNK